MLPALRQFYNTFLTYQNSFNTELFNQLTYEQLELEKIRRELQRRITEL